MERHAVIRPFEYATFDREKVGKSTVFRSERVLVGLNAFEPGQEHEVHVHEGMDKVYHVLSGRGTFHLDGREINVEAGEMLIAPEGVPHGVRNDSRGRLLVLAILAPSPPAKD